MSKAKIESVVCPKCKSTKREDEVTDDGELYLCLNCGTWYDKEGNENYNGIYKVPCPECGIWIDHLDSSVGTSCETKFYLEDNKPVYDEDGKIKEDRTDYFCSTCGKKVADTEKEAIEFLRQAQGYKNNLPNAPPNPLKWEKRQQRKVKKT